MPRRRITRRRITTRQKQAKTTFKKFRPLVSLRVKPITIPNTSTYGEQFVKHSIVRSSQKGELANTRNVLETLRKSMKSYSPDINKMLVSARSNMKSTDIFGCGIEKAILRGTGLFDATTSKVTVGFDANGKPICRSWRHNAAKQTMLDNLRAASSKKINVKKIIAPAQKLGNCWFNTMFVTFFISDKGRKFFRYFRQMMIEGKRITPEGNKVDLNIEIARGFFFFNACIEAAFNNKNIALAMNTNHVIHKLYWTIKRADRERLSIPYEDEGGNPVNYYCALMDYIDDSSLRYARISEHTFHPEQLDEQVELYIVEFFNPRQARPLQFKIGKGKYVLDAAIIRDTSGEHVCSTLTCGGTEMGFDGASHARLEKFEWKSLINADKEWTFKGSLFDNNKNNPVLWNFRKDYHILFYYKTR